MSEIIWEWVASMKLAGGASEDVLEKLRAEVGIDLPEDYLAFLRHSNGAEGPVGDAEYLVVWRAEDVRRRNDQSGISRYRPALLAFGSDGGGEVYAFDLRSPEKPVVMVPYIGGGYEDILPMAPTFTELIRRLANTPATGNPS